ncbi:MAG: AAA family ATPase [Hydrogenophaga sp.]|nr:AAA family ATPase [Hydrogenophaga sp.]
MEPSNFLPLQSHWPNLYEHAHFAENYAYSDPQTAVIKLRCFAESLVGIIFQDLRLPSEPGDGFFEKLKSPDFQDLVGPAILQKLHAVRLLGNKAAHGREINAKTSLYLIEEAYLVGQWFYKTYSGDTSGHYPPYCPPEPATEPTEAPDDLARQLTEAKAQLARLEASEQEALAKVASLHQSLDQAKIQDFKAGATQALRSIDFKPAGSHRQIGIRDAFSEFDLSSGQSELVDRLGEFLDGDARSVFLLKGYAGTGKTFITKGLTEYFRAIGRNYILAAPTGKASKVIANKTKSEAYTIHKTIYSFDDIAEYRDGDEEGTETFKFYAQLRVNSLSADTVYIVDEASMISDVYQEAEFFRFGTGYLLRDFLKFVNLDHNDHSKKVIFIGDNAQLPPVGMNSSPALDADYLRCEHHVHSTSFELTQVVRQKSESGVIANAIPLRQSLHDNVFNRLSINFGYPDVEEVKHKDLMARYIESCGNKINGESIVIAHSNSDVADYNQRIREHFFPGHTQLMAGDKVMAVSNSDVYGLFISNGDFGLIRQVLGEPEQRTVTLRRKASETGPVEEIQVALVFRDVAIGFKDLNGLPHFFRAKVLEDLLYNKETNLSSDQNKALYLDFCIRNSDLPRKSVEFKHALKSDPYFNALRLKFGYAITCHKAQGSEWNHVFVKCKSHMNQLTSDYFRWLYTAITRTAGHLYLLDPPNRGPWDSIKVVPNLGVGLTPGIRVSRPEQESESAPVMGAPQTSTPAAQGDQFSFGIPESATFLRALLAEVRKRIEPTAIVIDSIQHHRYQEAYVFKRGVELARVDIGYSARSRVASVVAPLLTDMSSDLLNLLMQLKGLPLDPGATGPVTDQSFSKPFLNEFHQKVTGLCTEAGIVIRNVVEQPWSLRYTFIRSGEVAVYDVWYNGRSQIGRCAPLTAACSPGTLVDDVGVLLTQGVRR